MDPHGDRYALFEKYLSGACTPKEIETLFHHFGVAQDEAALRRLIRSALLERGRADAELHARVEAFTERVGERLWAETAKERRFSWGWRLVAASLAAVITIGAMAYVLVKSDEPAEQLVSEYGGEVLPGGNRATLTLADGRIIELNAEREGIIVGDGITYVDGSDVLRQAIKAGKQKPEDDSNIQYAALTTPKGGTYQVVLPDGSKVWLNAATSLTYPLSFTGTRRIVELEGEAYFEVREQRSATGGRSVNVPFVVKTRGQEVEVLGTQFNISAYADDEETKTTLVEGKVNVVIAGAATALQPSEQATLRGGELEIKEVDTTPFVDWKNGLFSFNETGLRDAMSQLSRWYDLEVTYSEAVSETYFFGKIKRDKSLSKVLNILRKSGLNFRIENSGEQNRLIVLP